ncbi:MAG: NifB/NifX family molybdenum-iron cluster-binding protein [Acidobacteria bacterium]|jgi:predicted Fe-Mo cluster-binding NifX family protein|nr:NifB/NifX family molybdenum-iron cluster-binding protein [Acidobacteriota bacterium]
MKIVLTATGEVLDSQLDPRFGRAPWFILVDTDSGDIQTVENSSGVEAEQGAGVQAAEVVSRLGAQCVVTGHCGPRAFRALQAAGIEVFTGASGTVAEAVEQLKAGALEKAHGPDVVGHWA